LKVRGKVYQKCRQKEFAGQLKNPFGLAHSEERKLHRLNVASSFFIDYS
jgi:hypothetical protein